MDGGRFLKLICPEMVTVCGSVKMTEPVSELAAENLLQFIVSSNKSFMFISNI